MGGQTAAPVFSVERGFYSAPFQVTLTTATSGAKVRFTINGATPSSTVGTLYSGPISISTTTPLRAVAYATGLTNSDVVTHTYLFTAKVIQQPNNPSGYPSLFAAT